VGATGQVRRVQSPRGQRRRIGTKPATPTRPSVSGCVA